MGSIRWRHGNNCFVKRHFQLKITLDCYLFLTLSCSFLPQWFLQKCLSFRLPKGEGSYKMWHLLRTMNIIPCGKDKLLWAGMPVLTLCRIKPSRTWQFDTLRERSILIGSSFVCGVSWSFISLCQCKGTFKQQHYALHWSLIYWHLFFGDKHTQILGDAILFPGLFFHRNVCFFTLCWIE